MSTSGLLNLKSGDALVADIGDLTATAAEINAVADASARVADATASTLAVTVALHDKKIITLNRAAGVTATLPAASGSGAHFTFLVVTTTTTNGYIIKVANASDTMAGQAFMEEAGGSTASVFPASGTDDTMTLNGGTKGGLIGDRIEFIDADANLWIVQGFLTTTGTEETPFSATVS